MKIEQSGNELLIDGQKNEVKEFIKVLRTVSLDGELTSKHICLLASNLTKLVRIPKGKVMYRMSIPRLVETYTKIITECIPKDHILEITDPNSGFIDLGDSKLFYRISSSGSSVVFLLKDLK
ncbi:MAG: hypothetical protein ACRCX2_13600 [Paraclostridium sp.]